jgi:large subunit ribosomal protein L21
MFAFAEIAGIQYKIFIGKFIYVPLLKKELGDYIFFDRVLLLNDVNNKINIGTPFIEGAKIKAKILQHLKSDKVIVFKKKRRKGYRIKKGHRQKISKIKIVSLIYGS